MDSFLCFIKKICFGYIRRNVIPKHIVFLVNEVPRYYTQQNQFNSKTYEQNFQKILMCVDWCSALKIRELSIYTCSSSTLKYHSEGMNNMIRAFETVINEWLSDLEIYEKSFINQKGVRVIIIDKMSLLPDRTNMAIHKLMHLTENNTNVTLTIVIGYLGERNITGLLENFRNEIKYCEESSVLRSKFYKRLFNYRLNEPELVISNCIHRRLTDYLVWKIPSRHIQHIHVKWADFSWWDFIVSLIHFQYHQLKL